MGAVWSALLVGGGLAGALFVWLLRDTGKDADAEQEDDPSGEAAASAGGDEGAGGGLTPGPSSGELGSKPEHLHESNGCLVSETKGHGNLQEAAACRMQSPGQGGDSDNSKEHVPSAQFSDTDSLATSKTGNYRDYSEASRNESLKGEWGFQRGQETAAKAAPYFAEKLPSSNLVMDRAKEVSLGQLDSQDPDDHENWEMVSRHSSWGDTGLGGSLEASLLCPNQGTDYGRSTVVEARGQELEVKPKRVVAMSSESQHINVRFQVHYITSTGVQFIAVTGDHKSLGSWNTYIPLQYSKDGFWSRSVSLPADTMVEWKFVVVDNGRVTRWEECSNRSLETGHKDKVVHKWWGIH